MSRLEEKLYALDNSKYRDPYVRVTYDKLFHRSKTLLAGVLVPSANWDVFNTMFLDTLHNLKEIAEYTIIILNAQFKLTEERLTKITNVFTQLGFEYRIMNMYKRYDISKGVPLNRIVDDMCEVCPNEVEVYIRTDDDFLFYDKSDSVQKTSGQQYLEIIHYMITHPQCGVVNTFGTALSKYPGKYKIGPSKTCYNIKNFQDISYTGKGLFLRNIDEIRGHTLPKDLLELDLLSGGEDIISAGIRTYLGYYTAKCSCVRIRHVYQHSNDRDQKKDNDDYGWYNSENELKVESYIKNKFNENYTIKYNNMSLVKPEYYLNSGGINFFDNKNMLNDMIHDYTDHSVDEVKCSIDMLCRCNYYGE